MFIKLDGGQAYRGSKVADVQVASRVPRLRSWNVRKRRHASTNLYDIQDADAQMLSTIRRAGDGPDRRHLG